MKVAVGLLTLLSAVPVRADASSELGDRLIEVARSGCDYLHAHGFADPKVVWPARQLAAHFGRVVRRVPFGATHDYYLAVPNFSDWKVIFEERIVTFYLPVSVTLRMSELVKRLGNPNPPDVDHARVVDDVDAAKATPVEWVFPKSAERRGCWIRATTDGAGDDIGAQRVLTFSFQD